MARLEPIVGRSLRFGLRRVAEGRRCSASSSASPSCSASLACVIPAIWLAVCWCVCVPALLFERIGPFKALGRSFSLIKGRWWASFLLLVVGYLLVVDRRRRRPVRPARASPRRSRTTAPSPARSRTVVGSTLSSAITYPYLAAVLTILYFDQRVRKEGFDLQLLAEGLGGERDPDAPLPAPLIGDDLYTPEQRAAAPLLAAAAGLVAAAG